MKNINLKNQNIFILGLGKSGRASTLLALRQGANVFLYDRKIDHAKDFVSTLQDKAKITIVPKLKKRELIKANLVVVSPSIILSKSLKKFLFKNGISLISELEFGACFINAPIYAITGTNGKTTTSTLLYSILSKVYNNSFLLGNVGNAISEFASQTTLDPIVCEVSSYQLENIHSFHPKISAILNLGVDHLKHHKTLENYHNAKLEIFKNMTQNDFAVLNYDDPVVLEKTKNINAKIFYFSTKKPVVGTFIQDDIIKFSDGATSFDIISIHDLKLVGTHNLSNVLCATCMAILSGVSREVIATTLSEFKTLSHRLEFVKILDGVTYINDSKATNVESTLVAIDALKNEKIILLVGGSSKGEKFDRLFSPYHLNIKKVICFGQTRNKLAKCAKRHHYDVLVAQTLSKATTLARQLAQKGNTVLLSPACASFDEFSNFEERGNTFKQILN